jgi:hypothetical protein
MRKTLGWEGEGLIKNSNVLEVIVWFLSSWRGLLHSIEQVNRKGKPASLRCCEVGFQDI